VIFEFEGQDVMNVDLVDYRRPSCEGDETPMSRMHNPPHPGEVIKEPCLDPLKLTVTAAADGLGVSRRTLSALPNGHAGISPDMAIRLSKAFGRSPESWLKLLLQ
jgi:addiction module HigA family antidote